MTAPDRIQITHQPRTMTTDSADCALSQPSPETSATGALTDIQLWELLPKRLEQNLLAMVQVAAPHHNLRPIELLQIIAPDFVDYARAVLKAKPQAERPSEKDLYDLAAEFDGDPVPAMRRALELWGNPLQGAPAPGENLATPPAPEPGEVEELHPLWYLVEFLEGHSSFLRRTDPTDELAQILSDSATLLQQQEAELAALRGVPVPVSECPHCGYEGEMVPVTQAGEVEEPVAASEWDNGFMAGVCVALATVTVHYDSVIWKEIVESVGTDSLLNYAANVNPEDWDLAGFGKYAQAELGKGKPLPAPQAEEVEA